MSPPGFESRFCPCQVARFLAPAPSPLAGFLRPQKGLRGHSLSSPPSLLGVWLAPSRGAGTERAQTLRACCAFAFVEGVWEPRMGTSVFPKVNARMSSEDMNTTSGNFWGAKDPQSQTAGDARAPALRPPPAPAQENSEPWPGQPHPPGPIVTLDPCAVSRRPANSGSLRRRAQLSTAEKRPGLTAPARGAVHFGTCSLPRSIVGVAVPVQSRRWNLRVLEL